MNATLTQRNRWVFAWVLCCLLTTVTVSPMWAQLGTATLSGVVTDSTDAIVVGATVAAVNRATGFRRQTVSNDQGLYNLPGLTPGSYNVSVEFTGFRRAELKDITLQVDQNARINVRLEVGQTSETVEITAAAPLINTESASLGAVVDMQKILALPLNGRNFMQLALLVPGVTTGTEGGGVGAEGFSANGLRADQNAFQIDGTSNSDPLRNQVAVKPSIDSLQEFKIQTSNYSAEFGKGAGAQVNIVTRSGTQEFHGTLWEFNRNNKTQARNFFDRNSRSFPCDKSDPNITGRAACAPQYNQNQFGANLGGPITKRTFFFGAFEGFRQRQGRALINQVPTLAQRDGDFSQNLLTTAAGGTDGLGRSWRRGQLFDAKTSRQVTLANGTTRFVRDPFVGNIIPKSWWDPVAPRMVSNNEFMPLPNAPGITGANGDTLENYLDSRSNKSDNEQFSGRIDHQFSPNDTIYGRVSFVDGRSYNPGNYPGFGSLNDLRNINTTISYTKIFTPSVIGEFKFGNQGWFQTQGAEDGIAGKDWLAVFNMPGMDFVRASGNLGSPAVNITGFNGFGNGSGPFSYRNFTNQPIAIVSFNKGKHFMKVGGELRNVRMNSAGPLLGDGGTRGTLNYDNLNWTGIEGVTNVGHTFASFLGGLAGQKTRLVGDFRINYTSREWGAFFQDDWKVRRNLTLNIGLRYMYFTPPYDDRNAVSSWQQKQFCPSYSVCGSNYLNLPADSPYQARYSLAGVDLPRSLSNTDKNNIGPRFGFAWQPFGNGKTVIRGGYGIFFDTAPISMYGDTLINYPQVIEDQENVALGQFGPPVRNALIGFRISKPGLGDGGPGSVAQFQPGPNNFNPDFHNPYIQNWNFSVQRELPGNMVLELAYTGSKGTRLNRLIVVNLAEPLGPLATIPNLIGNPNIRTDIGDSQNQLRRLVPATIEKGVIIPLQNVFEVRSTAFSNYNAGTIRLEKRLSSGLTFIHSYTFGKAISDNPGRSGGGQGLNSAGAQNIFNLGAEKGLADLDHRHRFSSAVVYELPFGRGSSRMLTKMLVAGWATDGILSVQTGLPMTVTFSSDVGSMGTNQALRPDLICNPNLPGDQQTLDKFFDTACLVQQTPMYYGSAGRAIITSPGTTNLDLALRKNFRFTEKFNLQFRSEFFNSLNHANFNPPNRVLGNSNFGRITGAREPRIIQFGLKLLF